jgi:hypothetical protein
MDPISVMTAVSVGLKIVDQFREVTLRVLGKESKPPGSVAQQVGEEIQISHQGDVYQRINVDGLHLESVDAVALSALQRRVRAQVDVYFELFAEETLLSVDERARIRVRMNEMRGGLCRDFRSLVGMYEQILGTALPDHYTLYEVCNS